MPLAIHLPRFVHGESHELLFGELRVHIVPSAKLIDQTTGTTVPEMVMRNGKPVRDSIDVSPPDRWPDKRI